MSTWEGGGRGGCAAARLELAHLSLSTERVTRVLRWTLLRFERRAQRRLRALGGWTPAPPPPCAHGDNMMPTWVGMEQVGYFADNELMWLGRWTPRGNVRGQPLLPAPGTGATLSL